MENKRQTGFVVFVDSDCDMTKKRADELGFHLISMPYNINGKEVHPYEDFEVFECKEFYDLLRKGAMPKTSALNPKDYENYFEPFLKDGKDILYVHFSACMSGTFNALNIAMKTLKEKYPQNDIYAVDTKAITMGAYTILLEVADLYNAGASIQEIIDWVNNNADKFATYFFADDLTFFKRSGRVKSLTAFMGNMFGIRPIININSEGIMDSIDKARGLSSTLQKILDYIDALQEDIDKHYITIAHTDSPENANLLAEKIKEKYGNNLKMEIIPCNPTAGCHCGPNAVGVGFHAKHR